MAITINNLYFHYTPNEPVLTDINLEINTSTAIIGQNGAGKTTLAKLLNGLLKPVKGDIELDNLNTKNHSTAKLAHKIGYAFQNPDQQLFHNKVLDEAMFGPLNIGLDKKTAKANALTALEKLGLQEYSNENPYDLSLAERKLLTIASIIAMDTDIILLDEPTIAQDHQGIEKIKELILDLQKNKLVLVISHDMDLIVSTLPKTLVLTEGEVLIHDDTIKVFSQPEILTSAKVLPPAITQLAKALDWSETILTKEEFINTYRNR